MKTFVAFLGLALTVPIHGKAHPQYWGGGHQRFHSLSARSSAVTMSSPVAVFEGGTLSSSATGTAPPSSTQGIISPLSNASTSASGSGVGISSNCYRPNGVPMGWLPNGVDIMTIQNQVDSSHGPCTYGNYAQIKSATSMSEPDSAMDAQAKPSSLHGAIYNIALQPFIPFSQVSASAVAASMNKILAEGPQVIWLRLAHEVNWYIDTNTKNTDPSIKYHGTTDEFKAMWQAVAKAVDRSRVKMFWSPVGPFNEGDTVDTLDADWFPGHEYVDIAGLDAYGQMINGERTTFEARMSAFCGKYPDIPVALGETGWLQGGTAADKEYWLGQVTSKKTLEICPQYIGESFLNHWGYSFAATFLIRPRFLQYGLMLRNGTLTRVFMVRVQQGWRLQTCHGV